MTTKSSSSSPTGSPLRDQLRPPNAAQVGRVWSAIEARREQPRRSPLVALAGAVVIAVMAIAIIRGTGDHTSAAGPVATIGGAPFGGAVIGAVTLADGTTVTADPDAALAVVANTATRVDLALAGGRARFSITPGGPRHWHVAAGAIAVDVVGTIFTVDRSATRVRVSVERGVVEVRGPAADVPLHRLVAGDALELPVAVVASAPPSSTSTSPSLASAHVASAPSAVATAASASPAHASSVATTSAAVASPKPASATSTIPTNTMSSTEPPAPPAHTVEPTSPPPPPPPPPTATIETSEALLLEADRARRAGDVDRALAILATVAARNDALAATAALTRARLELDVAGRPADAIGDLQTAIARGLPPALEETARARLVDAFARSARRLDAKAAADDYLARYPTGAYADRIAKDLR